MRLLLSATLLTATSPAVPATAENLEHTRQLLSTKQCQKCDLSGVGLIMAELSGAHLSGADLSRANLSRANLIGADLRGAKLNGASLYGANLTGADLTGADLTGADLRQSYLVNANLVGVNLNNVYLQGAIGIPNYAGTPEDFYKLGVAETEKANFVSSIDHYNQALSLKPDFAAAYLARAISRYQLGDDRGATTDAKIAGQLFTTQKNKPGYESSQNFIKAIELASQPSKPEGGGSNLSNLVGGIASLLLKLVF